MYDFVKRIMDIIIAILLLITLFPVFIVFPLAIKLFDGGPVFADMPKRLGKNKKKFFLLKFRSMSLGAHDAMLHNPTFRKIKEKWIANQHKLPIKDDIRITPIGRITRRTDLDELAQVFNVLKGEMSIVGPRAIFEHEMKEYIKEYPETKKYFEHYFDVKPGITGVWQVSGRNNIPTPERIKMESEYAQRKNLWDDIVVILKTPFVMLTRKGANE